jgi:hypothetical protein
MFYVSGNEKNKNNLWCGTSGYENNEA